MKSGDVLVQVDQFKPLHVQNIEDSVGPSSSAFINWQHHEMFVSDDFSEEGVIEAIVVLLVLAIGLFEEVENFGFACNFYHFIF